MIGVIGGWGLPRDNLSKSLDAAAQRKGSYSCGAESSHH
jgi:hypothetical protein